MSCSESSACVIVGIDRYRERGQAMVEMVIAIPVLLMLLLAIIELAFGYRAFLTLQYAAQEAARLAAMHNAQYPAMRKGLVNGMAPLFVGHVEVEDEFTAESRALEDAFRYATREVDDFMSVVRVNPPPEAFRADFAEELLIKAASKKESDFETVLIPNERLIFRSAKEDSATDLTIQDANLLKITIEYCYELKTPIWRNILPSLLPDSARATQFDERRLDLCAVDNRKGLILRTDAMARMQSAIWENCNVRQRGGAAAGRVSAVCHQP